MELFEAVALDVWRTKQQEQIKEEFRLEKELNGLEETMRRIDELIIKGVFDDETYKQKSGELKNEIMVKKLELNEARIELSDIDACLNYCKAFLSNIANLWANSELNLKQRFQTFIFPDKIYYEGKTFRTTATALIFKQLQSNPITKSDLVTLTGFEPVSRA